MWRAGAWHGPANIMPPRLHLNPCLRQLCRLAAVLLLGAAGAAPATRAGEPDSDLRLVIMVTRHGVRSPLYTNNELGRFAAQPWPQWTVAPGILTPHGRQQMILMGAYYRALYTAEGLLTGDAATDLPRVYFRASSFQRTRETAQDLAAGMLPGATIELHARPLDEFDPMFRPVMLPVGHPDRNLGVAAVLGRIGQDPTAVLRACTPEFATLHRVLLGIGAMPAGKVDLRDLPATVVPGTGDSTVTVQGPLRTAMQITDNLMLEYAEGMPMAEVGWGRLTPADLTQLIRLHSLYFDLAHATFYPAQAQASNLASHILLTVDQAASGRPDPGAFGTLAHRLVVIVGHDTNIIGLGGLLGLSWWLPGTQPNPVLPGGALVFELRQRRQNHQFTVRAYYLSQTLEQMRALDPLTPKNPPARAPIFLPGCSEAGPGFDAPLGRFDELLRRVIDPGFVLPSPN